jgi:hypothetical protein
MSQHSWGGLRPEPFATLARGRFVTNRIALGIAVVIMGFLVADAAFLGWGVPMYLARVVDGLVQRLVFW